VIDHDASGDRWRWRHLGWSLPSLALIAMQMRPVIPCANRAVLGTLDGADALLQSGILTWTARRLGDPAAWSALPIFHPSTTSLMSMDSLAGQALAVLPAMWLGDPTPALLYNLAVVVTLLLVAAGGATLWLATSAGQPAGRRAAGAGLCALLLLGSPFTTWQLGMVNQISPPAVVLLMAALIGGGLRLAAGGDARRWWWAAAACLAMQAAWGWYGFGDAVFVMVVAVPVGAWLAWRRGRLGALARHAGPPLLLAMAVVLLLAAPYLRLRTETPEYTRELGAVAHYSTQLSMLGNLGPHRLQPADLAGQGGPAAERALRNTDAVLHPGWLTALMALAGLWRWRRLSPALRGVALFLSAVGLVGFVMSLGDSGGWPPGSDRRVTFPFGYLRDAFMPFQAYRAPVRFVFLAVVATTWWATLGAMGAMGVGERPATGRRRATLAVAWMLVWLESVPVALLAVPVAVDGRSGVGALPAGTPSGAILSLPEPGTEAEETVLDSLWLHRALATGRAYTGGQSGWVPPATRRLRRQLVECEAGTRDTAALLDSLRAAGVAGAELALDAPAGRVAFWSDALRKQGCVAAPTAPGYRFYAWPR
jgi:hypothetical protein